MSQPKYGQINCGLTILIVSLFSPCRLRNTTHFSSGTVDKSKWPVFLQNASGNRTHHCHKPTWLNKVTTQQSLITISLAAFPAKLSSFNSCLRQNAYHRNFKSIFEELLPCYCYATKANSRTIRSPVRNLPLQGKKRIKWTASSSLHGTRTVNLTFVQCECHIVKQTVIARINPTNQN